MSSSLRFGINSKGMVCLPGLSPAETFELEELLFHDGSLSAKARLKELREEHERAAELPAEDE